MELLGQMEQQVPLVRELRALPELQEQQAQTELRVQPV